MGISKWPKYDSGIQRVGLGLLSDTEYKGKRTGVEIRTSGWMLNLSQLLIT